MKEEKKILADESYLAGEKGKAPPPDKLLCTGQRGGARDARLKFFFSSS
jgi:hypothetical protein